MHPEEVAAGKSIQGSSKSTWECLNLTGLQQPAHSPSCQWCMALKGENAFAQDNTDLHRLELLCQKELGLWYVGMHFTVGKTQLYFHIICYYMCVVWTRALYMLAKSPATWAPCPALRRPRQEDWLQFATSWGFRVGSSLGCIVRPCLEANKLEEEKRRRRN